MNIETAKTYVAISYPAATITVDGFGDFDAVGPSGFRVFEFDAVFGALYDLTVEGGSREITEQEATTTIALVAVVAA